MSHELKLKTCTDYQFPNGLHFPINPGNFNPDYRKLQHCCFIMVHRLSPNDL